MSSHMRLTTPIDQSIDQVYRRLTDPDVIARASVADLEDADPAKVSVTHTFDGKFLVASPCEDGQATMVLEPLGDGRFTAHTDFQLWAQTAEVHEDSVFTQTGGGVMWEAEFHVDSKIPLMGGILEKRLENAMRERAARFARMLGEGSGTTEKREVKGGTRRSENMNNVTEDPDITQSFE